MRDEEAEEAHHFLHGAVRVVEKRAFLMNGEFVDVCFTGRDGLLADPGNAVLRDRNFKAVPVQGSGFGEMVFEDDADAVALMDLNGRAGAGAVVSPGVNGFNGAIFRRTGSARRWKTLTPASNSNGRSGKSGVVMGTKGAGGGSGCFLCEP